MVYNSKIRVKNLQRVTKNTTVSESLLKEIKNLADEKSTPFNFLIEDGMLWVLQTYKNKNSFLPPAKPDDRKQMGTTFDEKLYESLKERAKKLNTQTNTLIEAAMVYIIQQHKEK